MRAHAHTNTPRVVSASLLRGGRGRLSGSAESRESVQFRRAISRVSSVAYCNVEEAGVCVLVIGHLSSSFTVQYSTSSLCGNQETDRLPKK